MIRCADCGHSMYPWPRGYRCIENDCPIGLFNLGDVHSATILREKLERESLLSY